jgi:LPXTG-motif cell wall-anchored protein
MFQALFWQDFLNEINEMAVTPYNLKSGAYVVVNANGSYGSVRNTAKTVATAVQRYNKGTKVGTLTGGLQIFNINNKKYEMCEVLLTTPVKPNFITTHYRLWFQTANLDVAVEKAPTPKLPTKVVEKAKAKAKLPTAKAKVSDQTDATVKDTYQDYYEEVPETSTNWGLIIVGILLLIFAIYLIVRKIKNKKKRAMEAVKKLVNPTLKP